MTEYEDIEPGRIKHLEMIQGVIGRLGNDSFLIKGWAVTVAAALIGFAVNLSNWWLAVTSMVISVIFWILDSCYLRDERLFRRLFDCVREKEARLPPFFMAATGKEFIKLIGDTYCSRRAVFWSKTLKIFYGALELAAIAAIAVALVSEPGAPP